MDFYFSQSKIIFKGYTLDDSLIKMVALKKITQPKGKYLHLKFRKKTFAGFL